MQSVNSTPVGVILGDALTAGALAGVVLAEEGLPGGGLVGVAVAEAALPSVMTVGGALIVALGSLGGLGEAAVLFDVEVLGAGG